MRGYPDRAKDGGTPKLDVLAQVPPLPDMIHLDRVWKLDGTDPLRGLHMWEPTDEVDRLIRNYLLNFAAKVVLAERRRVAALSPTKKMTDNQRGS